MKNPIFKNSSGMREAFSNMWYSNACSIAEIEDAVEDSNNGMELVNKLNNLKLFYKFELDRETDTKVRLKTNDCWGNVHYFEATKEPKIEKEKQLAGIITDAMNGRFSKKEFCDAMSREHRYLQGEFTELCIWWFEKCAEMYEQGNYDDRNKYGCVVGNQITKFLSE